MSTCSAIAVGACGLKYRTIRRRKTDVCTTPEASGQRDSTVILELITQKNNSEANNILYKENKERKKMDQIWRSREKSLFDRVSVTERNT